jgi:hypothetical protein
MAKPVISILVEGDGEVRAAPVLVRRLLHEAYARYDFDLRPMNARGGGNIMRKGGLERFLQIARRVAVGVLVLKDAEREYVDCPVSLAYELSARAAALKLQIPVAVACAVCEYESWFLISLHTTREVFLRSDAVYAGNPEQECGAKGWLERHRNKQDYTKYKEVEHQELLTARLDLPHTLAHSRSFRRLAHAVQELLAAIDAAAPTFTPAPPV